MLNRFEGEVLHLYFLMIFLSINFN